MRQISSTRQQLIPFAFVGSFSTLTHLLLVTLMVQYAHFKPLVANIIAYFITVNISYVGHRYITFANMGKNRQLRFFHYLLVSLIAFLLNEFLYFIFLYYTVFNYFVSLVLVIVLVAIFTFVFSRWWACR